LKLLQHLGITQHWQESSFLDFRNLIYCYTNIIGFLNFHSFAFSQQLLVPPPLNLVVYLNARISRFITFHHELALSNAMLVSISSGTYFSDGSSLSFTYCPRFVNRPFSTVFGTYSSVSSTF